MSYLIKCPKCNNMTEDSGYDLGCSVCGKVVPFVEFSNQSLLQKNDTKFKYGSFLPGDFNIDGIDCPIATFKSEGLAKYLNLKNLYITITGYVPRLGIFSPTCSFKELEAIAVLKRIKSHKNDKVLIVSSAGNSARAFAYYAALFKVKTLIIIADESRSYLWLPNHSKIDENLNKYVKLVSIRKPSSYHDASKLAALINQKMNDKSEIEGGFTNISRIKGLGLVGTSFYDFVKRTPDYYFQAVGSGSGAISVMREYDSIDSANKVMYCLSQNKPYTPLVDSINNPKQKVEPSKYSPYADMVCAPMLTSSDPVYNYPGGIKEAIDSGKDFMGISVSNEETYEAQRLFYKYESIETLLPAATSIAALIKTSKKIDRNKTVQLNVTGAGESSVKNKFGYFYIPAVEVDSDILNNLEEFIKNLGDWLD